MSFDTTHYLAVKEDITARKETEQELITAREKAEESNRLKTAFMNNISHEVRTPLNGILGFGDFMMDENLSREEKLEYRHILHQSCDRLQQIITDIMDVSMIKSGSINPQKSGVCIGPVMKKLMSKTKEDCAKKNVLVTMDIPPQHENMILQTDEELFAKIVSHLLDNAQKFTSEGRITLGCQEKDEWVEFFVKDTGQGIAGEKLDLILEPFEQEDVSSTRGHEGSGIGIPIAKGLVELLGGKLRVESAKGEGTTFFFTLPLVTGVSEREQKSTDAARSKSPGETLILIAEDDEVNYQFLNAVARKGGFSTLHAWNGVEAVDFCRRYPEIALVLMDIKMPVMNGLEATTEIKSFRPDIPVIAVTAHAQTGDRERILQAGCDGYLSKPVRLNELSALFEKY